MLAGLLDGVAAAGLLLSLAENLMLPAQKKASRPGEFCLQRLRPGCFPGSSAALPG